MSIESPERHQHRTHRVLTSPHVATGTRVRRAIHRIVSLKRGQGRETIIDPASVASPRASSLCFSPTTPRTGFGPVRGVGRAPLSARGGFKHGSAKEGGWTVLAPSRLGSSGRSTGAVFGRAGFERDPRRNRGAEIARTKIHLWAVAKPVRQIWFGPSTTARGGDISLLRSEHAKQGSIGQYPSPDNKQD